MEKIISQSAFTGRYRIIGTDSRTGKILSQTPWIDNLVMNGANTGVRIAVARLVGTLTYDLTITKAKIGTGTNAPADGDTDLQTPVYTQNSIASASASGNVASLSIFMATGDLANGTYTEFALFAGTQIFTRSLISPSYVKGTNQDTTIEYEITVSN